MSFSHREYIFQGVVIPTLIIVLLLFIAIAISKKLVHNNVSTAMALIPIIVWLAAVFMSMYLFAEGMKYPLTAWIQAKYPTNITTGKVSEIHDAPTPPVYYDRSTRSFTAAKIIVVDEQPYYVLKTDTNVGDWVSIVWSTERNIVYDIKKISIYEDGAKLSSELPNTNHEDQQSSDIAELGKVIRNISFALCFGIFGIQYPVGRKLARFFQDRDQFVTECIIPNRYGIFWNGVVFAPVFGVLIGFTMTGFKGAGIIAIIGGIGLVVVTLIKQTTSLQIRQGALIYRVFNFTRVIDVKEIKSIEWGQSSVPFNRRLIIRLQGNGCIILDQEHYWGLENMYVQLKNLQNCLDEI